MADRVVAGAPAVAAVGLRKHWGQTTAVDGIDLHVGTGEVVALLGPNGAGKSTTIDMLLGLVPVDAGTISVRGLPPARACAAGLVGALQQTGGLLGAVTVRELVTLMRRIAPQPMPEAEVAERAGIGPLLDQRADRLSGGEVQRVRFAMAIAGDPEILFLDEPTVAMDVGTRRSFWASMRAWTEEGRTVLFATHYLEEADVFADRIVLMARGRIVADGNAREIKQIVSGRTIRVTLAGVDPAALQELPGVSGVERRQDSVELHCRDSDAALRALLERYPAARDIEVRSTALEDAFLALTGDDEEGDELREVPA